MEERGTRSFAGQIQRHVIPSLRANMRKMEAELPENHCCLLKYRAHFRGYGTT